MSERTTFINEFGNQIALSVDPVSIEQKPGVCIYISGPTSLTENTITLMEAQKLYEALGAALAASGYSSSAHAAPE